MFLLYLTKIQYKKKDQINKKMDISNSDIIYSSDDQREELRQPISNNLLSFDIQANETVDSVKQMFVTDQDDDSYFQISAFFEKFYRSQLVVKVKPKRILERAPLLQKYKGSFDVYNPKPYLYFLPVTILFKRKIDKILDLRDTMVKHLGLFGNVQIPKQKSDQIQVTIHDQQHKHLYTIRTNPLISKYNKHKMPHLLDPILCLDPLFDLYEKILEKTKFSQTCGIFMYWAYLNRILSSDYLNQTCIKIIVILFYRISQSAPNIIAHYTKENQKKLHKIRGLYQINNKMDCQLQDELFGHVNFSLMEKRSFYQESLNRYAIMTEILPIPYPVSREQIKQYTEFYKANQNKQVESRPKANYAIIKFFKILGYLQNCIKRSERIVFDLSTRRGVTTAIDLDFNIEVKHPIFGHNLCEKLSNDPSKLRIIKNLIGSVITTYKQNKSKPTQGIFKIFHPQ